jgi:hypothetical protein
MSITFALIGGIIAPFIVSFLKSKAWSAKVKQAVSIATSIAIGAGVTFIDGGMTDFSVANLLANVGVVFSVATVWYNQYFGDTAVNAVLESHGVGANVYQSEINNP